MLYTHCTCLLSEGAGISLVEVSIKQNKQQLTLERLRMNTLSYKYSNRTINYLNCVAYCIKKSLCMKCSLLYQL